MSTVYTKVVLHSLCNLSIRIHFRFEAGFYQDLSYAVVFADACFGVRIMLTSPCNVYPLTSHFYIVKLGFSGVYIIFLFLL